MHRLCLVAALGLSLAIPENALAQGGCSSGPTPGPGGIRIPVTPPSAPRGGGGNYKGPAGASRPAPSSPSGGSPVGPVSVGPTRPKPPMKAPYTFHGVEKISDAGAWQLWWDLNKDPYLQLTSIDTATPLSRDSDFFLGAGAEAQGPRQGRASTVDVRDSILPALYDAILLGGGGEFTPRAMVAIAKSSREDGRAKAESLFKNFMKMNHSREDRIAAISLGILGADASYPLLRALAFDTPAGRNLNGDKKVQTQVRAFALYGLGLLGHASRSSEMRSQVVHDLALMLEDGDSNVDLKVASVIAFGLVPLEVEVDGFACLCGTCHVEGPERSLQAQITYLMRYFTADKEFPDTVRAHAATALARLMERQSETDLRDIKEAVASLLITACQRSSGETASVRESCILALGLLGDADRDTVDGWIRGALGRAVSGSYMERRFALISTGLVSSRPGSGEEPFAGVAEGRKTLLFHLVSNRKDLRPWAALGLGVMGHWLRTAGEETSESVDIAMRNAIRGSTRASNLGAFAIASGMRRVRDANELLVTKVKKLKDPSALAYAAIGLGMTGDKSHAALLREKLAETKRFGGISASLGLALGLLDDTEIVDDLIEAYGASEDEDERCGYLAALGGIGDAASVALMTDTIRQSKRKSKLRTAAAIALGMTGDRRAIPWRAAMVRGTNYSSAPETLTNSEGTGVLDMP